MRVRFVISVSCLIIFFTSCTKEYDCIDLQVQLAFINYLPADIDTFVLRKFKPSDNYQTLIDTFVVNYGYYGFYQTSSDTTSVLVTDGKNGIRAGFDWQLYIPATNKTVLISDILSEKKTGKRGHGIFSMDPGPSCTNALFTAKVDNQLISFSISDTARHYIYIRN